MKINVRKYNQPDANAKNCLREYLGYYKHFVKCSVIISLLLKYCFANVSLSFDRSIDQVVSDQELENSLA